jgi:hypothetical protein
MVNELFIRSDSYLTNKYSKRWLATELLREYISITINKFLDLISNNPFLFKPLFPHLYMSPSDGTKSPSKNDYLRIYTYNIYTILQVPINILKGFEINSVFSLLETIAQEILK